MFVRKQKYFSARDIELQQSKIATIAGAAFSKNNHIDRPVENLFNRTTRRPQSAFLKLRELSKTKETDVTKLKLTINAFGTKQFSTSDGGIYIKNTEETADVYDINEEKRQDDLGKAHAVTRRIANKNNSTNGIDLSSIFATKMKVIITLICCLK